MNNPKSPATHVSKEIWDRAQQYELKAWKWQNSWVNSIVDAGKRFFGHKGVTVGDDWNNWWCEKFNNYEVIPNQNENAIELGCGPYTNIRLILNKKAIDHVVCSDPLVNEYILFKGQWLASQYARGAILLDNHPIEECPFSDNYFDLVILINVLDHVRDALVCLETAIRITKPKGFLIIGQDLTNESDMINTGNDIGHPIRLHHEDVDRSILNKFDPKLYKILSREDGRNPQAHYGTYLFIGQKNIR